MSKSDEFKQGRCARDLKSGKIGGDEPVEKRKSQENKRQLGAGTAQNGRSKLAHAVARLSSISALISYAASCSQKALAYFMQSSLAGMISTCAVQAMLRAAWDVFFLMTVLILT